MVDADKESKFMFFGGAISKNVFGGAPLTIHLCNDQLVSFKDIGYCKPFMEEPKPEEKKSAGPSIVKANKTRKLVAAGTAEIVEIEAELNTEEKAKDDAAE